MVKKIMVAVSLLAVIALVFAGCPSGTDDPVDDPLTQRVQALENRVNSLGGEYADAQSITNIHADLQQIYADIDALESPTDYSGDIDELLDAISDIEDRIQTLEDAEVVVPDIPIDMLSAYAELTLGKVRITTHAPRDMIVSYEVKFHINDPVEVGDPADSINDVIKLLYTDSPVQVKAGSVVLIPQFGLLYDSVDDQWLLHQVIFNTQGTDVNAGETIKDVTVLIATVGDYVTVKVMPVAESGSAPIW